MAETDKAPRRRRAPVGTASEASQEAPSGAARPAEVRSPIKAPVTLQRKLETFFAGLALPFMAAGDAQCAMVIAHRAPVLAEAWANLAAESPGVKRAIEAIMKGGAWGTAISATVATVIPIAAHHGAPVPDFISPMLFGTQNGGETTHEHQPEPEAPFVSAPTNGNGTPGPAAVSTPPTAPETDLTNPSVYAGN